MKRKITLILAVLLSLSAVLTACEFRNSKLPGEIAKDAAVISNGGNSVAYSGYLYFINGVEETEDSEGKNNVWGEIEKGGIYRAEFKDGNTAVDLKVADPFKLGADLVTPTLENGDAIKTFDVPSGDFPFKSHKAVDYDDEEIDVINVERVVPKIVTIVNDRGLFIYDGYIYYTTPNNRKDKTGTVQYTYVDFMRTSLDGSKTLRITTSQTADVQYNIYYQNGKTYLVTYENSTLTSFEIGKNRVSKKYQITDAATGVVFAPNKELWYKTIPTNRLSDYIFYTRANTDKDTVKVGNTVCMASPDGKVHRDIMNGKSFTLSKIVDEVLMYQYADLNNTILEYTDLAAELSELNGNVDIYQRDAEAKKTPIATKSGIALYNINNYSSYVAEKASPYDDTVTVWAIDGTGVTKFRNGETEGSVTDRITTEHINIQYFNKSSQTFFYTKANESGEYRTLYITDANKLSDEKVADSVATESTFYYNFGVDFVGDHMFYIVETIDEWAAKYMKTSRLMFADTSEEYFIGQRKEDDIPEDEEE